MEKIKTNICELKQGNLVQFKTKLFGRKRNITGEFVDYGCDTITWLVYLKNYKIEGVAIDNVNSEPQSFSMEYGEIIFKSID